MRTPTDSMATPLGFALLTPAYRVGADRHGEPTWTARMVKEASLPDPYRNTR